MEWLQSIIISFVTVFLTQFATILRDYLKCKHDDKQQKEELNRQKEIQKVKNLYKIIKPALHNAQVRAWIKKPNNYNQYYFEDLKNELDTDSVYNNKDLDEW